MNLSAALLTSEFHSACISAAVSTAVITIADKPSPAPSQNCRARPYRVAADLASEARGRRPLLRRRRPSPQRLREGRKPGIVQRR